MYKFKKIFVFVKDQRVDATDIMAKYRFGGVEEAQQFLLSSGFEYFMFTLEEAAK